MWEAVLIWLFVLQVFCSLQSIIKIPILWILKARKEILQHLSLISCSLKFTPRSLHFAQWLVAGIKGLSCYSQRASSFRSWARSWLFTDFSQEEKTLVPSEPRVTVSLFSCHMKNLQIVLPWNIPFSPKVLWVLVREAKEHFCSFTYLSAQQRAHIGLASGRKH